MKMPCIYRIGLPLASWLTLSRVVLLPVAVLPPALGWKGGWLFCGTVAALAGLTDILDGYVARKSGSTTDMGRDLDLLSDKVFVVGMLVFLGAKGVLHLWIPATVLIREAGVSLLRLHCSGSRPFAPDWLGKAKTAFSMIAIVLTAGWMDLKSGGAISAVAAGSWGETILAVAPHAMLLAVFLTLASGANYALKYLRPGGASRAGCLVD